jgi:hypothetical protein
MYWFNSKAFTAVAFVSGIALITCFQACKPGIKETGAALKYFDIKEYFKIDIARLNKVNKPVFKTVTHNGLTESKNIFISKWGRELDLFIESDINRPDWKNSYSVASTPGLLIYKAKYPELKMREMRIQKDNGKVKEILIFNRTENILYQTTEKLSYFPDSLYVIDKAQKVRLLGANAYCIKGLISR